MYEGGVKEPGTLVTTAWNQWTYFKDPHVYGLDLESPIVRADGVAKAVLLIHGMGGGPHTFLDWAKGFWEGGIPNVYTVQLEEENDEHALFAQVAERMNAIAQHCFAGGANRVDFSLQGHSLGAIAAAGQIWRGELVDERVSASMMISVAGRLHYDSSWSDFLCDDVRPEIEATFAEMEKRPSLATVFTIWGDCDGIIPAESAHFQNDPSKEFTVCGVGHLGILYAEEAVDCAVTWTKEWLQT